ncbi:MAG: potassium channel family protein [Beutenbergiaceae bacterium]
MFVSKRHMHDLARGEAVLVVGLGRFGSSLARELADGGVEVLGIDTDEDLVQQHSTQLTHVVRGDASREDLLRQLAVGEFTFAVVAIGSHLESSILVASHLLKLGVPNIWAKAISEAHGQILDQLGIHHVVYPEHDMGRRVAHLLSESVTEYTDLGGGFAMVTAPVPPGAVGKPVSQLRPREHHDVTIVAARKPDGDWSHVTDQSTLDWGDIVLLTGPEQALEAFTDLA